MSFQKYTIEYMTYNMSRVLDGQVELINSWFVIINGKVLG